MLKEIQYFQIMRILPVKGEINMLILPDQMDFYGKSVNDVKTKNACKVNMIVFVLLKYNVVYNM